MKATISQEFLARVLYCSSSKYMTVNKSKTSLIIHIRSGHFLDFSTLSFGSQRRLSSENRGRSETKNIYGPH